MPHMAPAVLIPLILQAVQTLAPLIQEIFGNKTDESGNETTKSNAKAYLDNQRTTKEFQDQFNRDLQDFKVKADALNVKLPISTTDPVDTSKEAYNLGLEFRAAAARPEYAGQKDLLNTQADACFKLADALAKDETNSGSGVVSPAAGYVSPVPGSWVPFTGGKEGIQLIPPDSPILQTTSN
jgi:hypothetical protein